MGNKTIADLSVSYTEIGFASAILERVLHHCTVISLKGDAYMLDSVYTNQVRMAAQIAIQRTCTAAIKASEVFA